MPVRDRLPWLVGGALAVALLLSPAIWNGYPLIFPDTGGYLARTFQGTLEFGRSALYGAFLRLGLPFDFWPNVIAQAALIAWLVYLTLRTHGLAHAVIFLLVAVMVLIDASSLPWYVGQLMPDILLPAAVLALHLLAFRRAALTRWERAGLVLVVAAAIASHMGTLALCLALIVILAVSMPLYRPWLRTGPPRLGLPAAAVIAGLILAPLSNLAITGQFAFTPGGESFLFGRLVQDGIVARYLKDKCPDPKIALCAHIERVPDSADEWLWTVRSPFYDLGGWKDYAAEERRIIADSVRLYPWEHLRAAVRSTLLQFANFTTDITTAPHEMVYTLQAFENYAPQILDRVRAARQQTGEVEVRPLNYLHVPVAVFSLLGLAVIAFAPRRARLQPQAVALAVTILLALLLNAAICGVFSNPVNRYQSRLIWLAPLAVMIAVATRTRENAA